MKILFVCDTLGSGGAERVISTLSNEFIKKGNQVGIVILSKSAGEPFYPLEKDVDVIYLTRNLSKKPNILKKSRLLKKEILARKPDAVIAFLSYVCIYTWWALRNTKIPYFVSERNDPHHRGRMRQFLLNRAFKRAAGCVFQTQDASNFYKYIKPNKKIIIYNPVSLSIENIKKKSGKSNVILSVGRLEPQKNPRLLLDAFKLFNKQHDGGYVLKMYGEGSLKQDLVNYVNGNNIRNVIFCGNSKTWQQDENNATMFVMTSDFEGLPNSLIEALCLGIPCVSTDCPIGGPKELIKSFTNLKLCEASNLNAVLKAMNLSLLTPHINCCIPDSFCTNTIAQKWLDFLH